MLSMPRKSAHRPRNASDEVGLPRKAATPEMERWLLAHVKQVSEGWSAGENPIRVHSAIGGGSVAAGCQPILDAITSNGNHLI